MFPQLGSCWALGVTERACDVFQLVSPPCCPSRTCPGQGSGCQDCVLHRQKHEVNTAMLVPHIGGCGMVVPCAVPLLPCAALCHPAVPCTFWCKDPGIPLCARPKEREFGFSLLILPAAPSHPINTCSSACPPARPQAHTSGTFLLSINPLNHTSPESMRD